MMSEGNFAFRKPLREIRGSRDLECFKESTAFSEFTGFVERLGKSVKGIKLTDEIAVGETCQRALQLLERLDGYIGDCPPEENPTRYGNPAFRAWHETLSQNVDSLLSGWVPEDSIVELREYLLVSFGNPQRIDYGTGHESAFATWLFCLWRLHMLTEADFPAVVLRVFDRYIELMFRLQKVYWIEPAGSHGVWGLDDYHFLPFYFGAGQLVGHVHIKPKAIHYNDYVDNFAKDYMYLRCIQNINAVKTESLVWHSPMLNDISSVRSWQKVFEGLMKMYKAEVLAKLPIMQHFLFGSLLSFTSSAAPPTEEELEAERKAEIFGAGCCSNVPSAAAARAMKDNPGAAACAPHPHQHAHSHSHAPGHLIPFD